MHKINPASVKGGIFATPAKPGGITSGVPMMPANGAAPYKKGGGIDSDDKPRGVPAMKHGKTNENVNKRLAPVDKAGKTSAADALKETRKPNSKGASNTGNSTYKGGKELPAFKKGGAVGGFSKMPKMCTTME
jgi:hypothetical protein